MGRWWVDFMPVDHGRSKLFFWMRPPSQHLSWNISKMSWAFGKIRCFNSCLLQTSWLAQLLTWVCLRWFVFSHYINHNNLGWFGLFFPIFQVRGQQIQEFSPWYVPFRGSESILWHGEMGLCCSQVPELSCQLSQPVLVVKDPTQISVFNLEANRIPNFFFFFFGNFSCFKNINLMDQVSQIWVIQRWFKSRVWHGCWGTQGPSWWRAWAFKAEAKWWQLATERWRFLHVFFLSRVITKT